MLPADPRHPMPRAALLSRRQALAGGLCLCCLPAFARAGSGTASLVTQEIAPGVHVRPAPHEEATPGNLDAIANVGFIVGRKAVAVIDPGGSLADGKRLRARIREVTALPIRYVTLSHVHPDHIFGAGAFLADEPQFVGHAMLPAALAQRGEFYRERLAEILGAANVGPVVPPNVLVERDMRLELGDRVLDLHAHATAHTTCDLSVLDRETGTLFTGDLLFVERAPSLDGSLTGWLRELDVLAAFGSRRAVPGHGPASVDFATASAPLERYLERLLVETRAAIARGIGIDAAPEVVAQSESGEWRLFEDYHGRNVTQAYKELEWE